MKKLNFGAWLLVAFLVLVGAKITDSVLNIGIKGSDAQINLSDGVVKYDSGLGKVRLSHNGIDFFTAGAGGGGASGVDLLDNPDFEITDDNWSSSGSSVQVHVTSGSNLLVGAGSLTWDASATSENLDSDLVNVPNGLKGGTCTASLLYLWDAGVSGDIKLQALDDSANLLSETDLDPTSNSVAREALIVFGCPTGSDQVRLRLTSTADAALIAIDQMFLGETKLTKVSQAELTAHAFYASTASCNPSINSASFVDFPTVAACPAITVEASTQTVNTSDNDLLDLVFDNLNQGIYTVTLYIHAEVTGLGGVTGGIRLVSSSGATGNNCLVQTANNGPTNHRLVCTLTETLISAQAITYKIQGFEAGTVILLLNDLALGGRQTEFRVVRYPLGTESSLTLPQAKFLIDVNIGSTFNATMLTSDQASYIGIFEANMDMVLNPANSQPNVQIPCDSTNPSTGLTCDTGEEGVGIVFQSDAGVYRVCGEFGYNYTLAGVSSRAFQFVETLNNSQAIIQEGGGRANIQAGSTQMGNQVHTCGIFSFSSGGQKTIRLMYEHLVVSGSVSSAILIMNRTAAAGQPDVHITVEAMSRTFTGIKLPELDEVVQSKGSGGTMNFVSAYILNSGTPTLSVEHGDWVDTIDDDATGRSTINFDAGVFSVAPNCVCTAVNEGQNCAILTKATTSSVQVITEVTSSEVDTDTNFNISCHGPQ